MQYNKQKNSFLTKTFGFAILCSFIFTNIFTVGIFAGTTNRKTVDTPALNGLTSDLTQLSRSGRVRGLANFEGETNRLIKMLAGDSLKQPVILDDKGKSQELVVEQLALRIAKGDVPASLRGKRILKLETATLFSNAENRKNVSQSIERIFNELAASNGEVILFIDELTNFIGSSQVNDVLTDALRQNKFRIIGGTSNTAYAEKIAVTAEISSLFETLTIGETQSGDAENTAGKSASGEGFRGDIVSPDLREMMQNDPTGKKRADVIIQAKDADDQTLRTILAQNNVHLQDRVGDTDTLLVNLPVSAIEAIAQSGTINYLSPDRTLNSLGHLENATGVNTTRSQPAIAGRPAYTLDGSGIGVAIVDSGMLVSHKNFKTATASRIVFNKNFVTSTNSTDDDYGHGTHVAGIVAGNSERNSGAYRGIAPNANLINLKVLDGEGKGKSSWLLDALQWLIANRTTYNIRVVNLSLGGLAIDSYTNDPVNRKVQELTALGVLVIAAAGNEGKDSDGNKLYGHIHSPGNDPSVLTVGAVNTKDTDSRTDDLMATFSSHGPTRSFYTNSNGDKVFDNAIKPDVVAPGNKIISAKAKSSSYLVTHYPNLSDSSLDSTADDSMLYMSGTSMATPVVTGAAALLFQVNPNLTPQMVKMIFEYTAQPLNGYNMLEQGAGQLNIEGAVRLAKAYRTDINFNTSATSGMSLLANGTAFPAVQTTLNGTTFAWAQGILTNYTLLKGQQLAGNFHPAYRNDSWFDKGVISNASGNFVFNSNFLSTGLSIIDNVLTSDGTVLDSGSTFCASSALISDGVLISDGQMFGDGVLISDGVLVSDGVLISDSTMATTSGGSIYGDN